MGKDRRSATPGEALHPEATLGDALYTERERRDLSQRDVTEELGVSQPTLSAWENDQYEPDGMYLPRITAWLGLKEAWVGDLLYWSKRARAELDQAVTDRRLDRH